MSVKKMTTGLIVGNRGFFPDHLAKSGREEMLRVLGAAGMDVVALSPEESKYGAVETREESRRCAELCPHRDRCGLEDGDQLAVDLGPCAGRGREGADVTEPERDIPLLQGILLVLCMFFVALNLIVDILQPLLDPRMGRS